MVSTIADILSEAEPVNRVKLILILRQPSGELGHEFWQLRRIGRWISVTGYDYRLLAVNPGLFCINLSIEQAVNGLNMFFAKGFPLGNCINIFISLGMTCCLVVVTYRLSPDGQAIFQQYFGFRFGCFIAFVVRLPLILLESEIARNSSYRFLKLQNR